MPAGPSRLRGSTAPNPVPGCPGLYSSGSYTRSEDIGLTGRSQGCRERPTPIGVRPSRRPYICSGALIDINSSVRASTVRVASSSASRAFVNAASSVITRHCV